MSGAVSEPVVAQAITTGPEQTRSLGQALGALLAPGDLVVLSGDLGAGKTCLTQGLGVGLGINDRITSPTFTLASTYHGRHRLHHLDVYRLDSLAETLDLDLPDLLDDGVTVIEWGERIVPVLPNDRLDVALRFVDPPADDDVRLLELVLNGDRWIERSSTIEAALAPWSPAC